MCIVTHYLLSSTPFLSFSCYPGDIGYIILNTVTGDLTLGGIALDYEGGDRSFTLTVGAIDNPDGTDQLQVSLLQLSWLATFHLLLYTSSVYGPICTDTPSGGLQ